MTDKREAILQRLTEIAAGLPGIVTAARNQDEISEHARPAIVVFDADETADERAVQRGHAGAAPNIVEMTPEVMILLGALPERVGSALNELRAATGQGGAHRRATGCAHRFKRAHALRRLQHASASRPLHRGPDGRAIRLHLRAAPSRTLKES